MWLKNVSRKISVGTMGCVGRKNRVKRKFKSNQAYKDVSTLITFLSQFKTDVAVLIGQLPMLTHEMMVHVPALIVHALQKKNVRI
jgi:hypothetical protein